MDTLEKCKKKREKFQALANKYQTKANQLQERLNAYEQAVIWRELNDIYDGLERKSRGDVLDDDLINIAR